MRLKDFIRVWCKYQLSLNWLNIVFRYCIKLLLVINLLIGLVAFVYKYKAVVGQFKFLVVGLALVDLLYKYKSPKSRQDLEAFHIAPYGVSFLAILNILQDILSLRNLMLPIFTTVLGLIIEPQYAAPFAYLLVLSCLHNLVAGIVSGRRKYVALVMVLMSIVIIYQLNMVLMNILLTIATLLVIYLRYVEKPYHKNDTVNYAFNFFANIRNPFLRLDFIVLKKSRHQHLTLARVIAICSLYFYLISGVYASELNSGGFGSIILIQIYYCLVPAILIPYILSSNHSYIGLLMTMPNLKDFFTTKLNFILVFQLLQTLILCAVNYSNYQTILLISSISIYSIFLITPVMFMGILLTDEKINIFDGSIGNSFFVQSFFQSVYFLIVMASSGVVLYAVQRISSDNFSWILVVLSMTGFFLRKRFTEFFTVHYYKMKYKLFNTLS